MRDLKGGAGWVDSMGGSQGCGHIWDPEHSRWV
jgi:hypothetical protein